MITTIPISSLKDESDKSPCKIVLGKGIFDLALAKVQGNLDDMRNRILSRFESELPTEENEKKAREYKQLNEDIKRAQKHIARVEKMKRGSVVLLSQIASVSKQRIISPKSSSDMLFGIQLESDDIKNIDEGLHKLFFSNQ